MKREIKFRGKRLTDGAWIYGDFFRNRGLSFIASDCIAENPLATWRDYNVDPDTVGQYTGLKDKNGKEIYEGDIIEYRGMHYVIVFWSGMFYASVEECNKDIYGGFPLWGCLDEDHEIARVIGNIHDNPELTKEK